MNRCGTRRRRNETRRCVGVVALTLSLTGCGTPPAVTPLLRVAERAMADELAHVEADRRRDAARLEASRDALRRAFDADLETVEALTADWVRDAVGVYVIAREELAAHGAALRAERDRRAENLAVARGALDRAGALLERQDALLGEARGGGAWDLAGALLGHE